METRANHIWVGAVSLALLAVLAAFIIWIARLGHADQREYDIFFKQSVDGLAKGSQVSFSGVPAGQIKTIDLWKRDPEFVRVRIKVDESIPVLQGTTAFIQGSFTGVSTIQLDGAVQARRRSPRSDPKASRSFPHAAAGWANCSATRRCCSSGWRR
jgi:phospholipid/cholesterol/gamma-HCH transport system substrate-binding protein